MFAILVYFTIAYIYYTGRLANRQSDIMRIGLAAKSGEEGDIVEQGNLVQNPGDVRCEVVNVFGTVVRCRLDFFVHETALSSRCACNEFLFCCVENERSNRR